MVPLSEVAVVTTATVELPVESFAWLFVLNPSVAVQFVCRHGRSKVYAISLLIYFKRP